MAVIIPWKARPRADGAGQGPIGPARIILFTGVRYERHDDASPGPQPVAPNATRPGQTRRTRRRA